MSRLKLNNAFHSMFFLKPCHRRRYFHYLVPVDGAREEESEWDGRIKEFGKVLRKDIREIRSAVGQSSKTSREEENTGTTSLTTKVLNIQDQMKVLTEGMDKMKKNLEEFLEKQTNKGPSGSR